MNIIKKLSSSEIRRWLTAHNLLIVVCLVLSLASFFVMRNYIKIKNQNKVEARGRALKSLLEKSFLQDLEVVYSIQNLFYSQKMVSRKQFKDFVTGSLRRHPGLQAVEQIIRVPYSDRANYENKIRSEGFSDFYLKELHPADGQIQKAGQRGEYFVVHYAEPLEDNLAALGYDVSFMPPAKQTMINAKKEGMAVSNWLPLAQGDVGFVVYLSIQGTENFAVAVFRLKRFVESAIKSLAPDGVDFTLEEINAPDGIDKIFKYDSADQRLLEVSSGRVCKGKSSTAILNIGQRMWKLTYMPSEQFKSIMHPGLPYLVAVTVLLLTLACTFLFKEREGRIKAETATKVREEFMTIASHELRTPLTPLKMELFLLKQLFKTGDVGHDKVLRLVNNADKQLNHIVALIDDLLDIGRLNQGKFDFHYSEFDFTQLIQKTTEKFLPMLQAHGCTISLDLQPGVIVYWDPIRIEQVIANCLSNSVKFAANTPVEIKMVAGDDMVTFSIKDKGIGVTADLKQKIFNRFERGVSVRSYGGLGIGLYIVQEIIHRHGGTVRLESAPGAGAEFIFKVPRRHV